MSNMSYCRFRNTLGDLLDCAHNMEGKLSEDEAQARIDLLMRCADILDDIGVEIDMIEVETIVQSYDFRQQEDEEGE